MFQQNTTSEINPLLAQRLKDFEEFVKKNIYSSTKIPQFAKIPKRYIGKNIDNFDSSNCKNEVERALKAIHSGRSLFLYGSCGTGKTHLAVGLIYEWCRMNFKATFDWRHDGLTIANYLNGELPLFAPAVEVLLELTEFFC